MSKLKEEETELETDRRAAWVAIRCAAAAAQAMRARRMMIGDTSITAQKVAEKSQYNMPDFTALDMMNPYVLGEKKKVFKSKRFTALLWCFAVCTCTAEVVLANCV